MIEIVYQILYIFRTLFNIVTWRDPILTFWITIFGPVIVIVLYCFPWRLALAVLGIVIFGPQNWAIRVIRERKGIFPPDLDIIPFKETEKKPKASLDNEPLFVSHFHQNEPPNYSNIDTSVTRHVLVPHSPLMFHDRFYDWPPEREFARVTADSLAEPKRESIVLANNYSKEIDVAKVAKMKHRLLKLRKQSNKSL